MATYNICYAIAGEPNSDAIDVPASYTVRELWTAIQAANEDLKSVPVRKILFYQTSIEDEGQLMEPVKAALDQEQLIPLGARRPLSEVYSSNPEPGYVHFLVVIPTYNAVPVSGPPPTRTKRSFDPESEAAKFPPRDVKRRRLSLVSQSATIYQTEPDQEREPRRKPQLPNQGGFEELISVPGLIAADKTRYIEKLDQDERYRYQFLRPRRWGKSTFLETLAKYYDKKNEPHFERIFGGLYIGKHPTKARHSLLVLCFNFSEISALDSYEKTKKDLNQHLIFVLRNFLDRYYDILQPGSTTLGALEGDDGTQALKAVLELVDNCNHKLFVGVDGYDAVANSVLFYGNPKEYNRIADLFKTQFFAIIKQASVVVKYWITGVMPVFRDGVNPLNAVTDVSHCPAFHGICGLTREEVQTIVEAYLSDRQPQRITNAAEDLRRWYDGYLFCEDSDLESPLDTLYNPELVFRHLRQIADCVMGIKPIDEIHDGRTSRILAKIPDQGKVSFVEMFLAAQSRRLQSQIVHGFGTAELEDLGSDPKIIQTLLYHLGVLTHTGDGQHLRIPNGTITSVFCNRFSRYLDTEVDLESLAQWAYESLINENVRGVVKLVEKFWGPLPVEALYHSNEDTLRTTLEALWFAPNIPRCIPEVCLVRNHNAAYGDGLYSFVDLVIASTGSIACLELKNLTLDELYKGEHGDDEKEERNAFRERLRKETEDELLKRTVEYWDSQECKDKKKTVGQIKTDAIQQLNGYLEAMTCGHAGNGSNGVVDDRLRSKPGTTTLIGYVVIGLGGTRVLGYLIEAKEIPYSYSFV